jgi:hypothetical protein
VLEEVLRIWKLVAAILLFSPLSQMAKADLCADPTTRAWVTCLAATTGSTGTGVAGTGASASATVTGASTDNFTSGGTFPSGAGRLYINPSTNDISLTGLVAGADGQQIIVFNTGSTYTITLVNQSASSTAANRFSGQGDAAIPPGGQQYVIYSSTLGRWSIG